MPDAITRLNQALEGRYQIDRELGEGGMATVYLADDLKHERKVALKVLKPELAAVVGAERFLAEIKTTANLTHPHILPLHDSGEADGFLFYVMPYVEGETLRDRIDRDKQLPVDEAVSLASKVAGALQHAHEHGVIHRDIKPGNILLQGGEPVVADFGIALAVGAGGSNRLTETGLSLGTPYYMSPEQATGDQAVGASTDTYALGSVLYEMLVGDPPYAGSTAQAVLGKIISGKPVSVTEHRPSVPANVDAAVRKALEKLPADRFTSARGFGAALFDSGFRHGAMVSVEAEAGTPSSRTVALVASVAVIGLALGWSLGRSSADTTDTLTPVRFTLPVPGGYETTVAAEVPSLAISPDGRVVVYRENGILVRRALDEEQAEPLAGTEAAGMPFFSPDGEWLGFLQGDGFKRMSSDGVATSIGNTLIDWVHGADWGADDAVVYGRSAFGIWRLPIQGGDAEAITSPAEFADESGHAWPQSLDGGSLLLFTALGPSGKWDDAKILLKDLETGQRFTVVEGGAYGRYVPTGHIVYATGDANIQAIPFDLELKEAGASFPLESGVLLGQWGGGASFVIAASGTLAFVRGDNSQRHLLYWYDGNGLRLSQLGGAMTADWGLEIDPRGQRVATTLPNSQNDDIHLLEAGMVNPRRLTSHPASEGWPVWSPDGTRLAWAGDSGGGASVLLQEVDGVGEPEVLYSAPGGVWPRSWSPDGRWLAISERTANGLDIIAVDVEDPDNVITVADGPSEEWDPQFSPDGAFIAFDSNDAGPFQTYVMPFPPVGDPILVSSGRAQHPKWSPTSPELYFWDDTTLTVAAFSTQPRFRVEELRPLFSVPDYVTSEDPYYTVRPDGEGFLIQVHNPASLAREIHIVLNWFEELKERTGN